MFSRVVFRNIPSACQLSRIIAAQSSKELSKNIASAHITPFAIVPNVFTGQMYSGKVNPEMMTVDYEYVKKASSDGNILIIDVREPDEVKELGKIPNSVNIPLGNVTTTLSSMPEKEFQQTYQRSKPAEDSEIIFYCMMGKRSGMAQQNAVNLGFKNVKNYLGSWTDWAAKTQ